MHARRLWGLAAAFGAVLLCSTSISGQNAAVTISVDANANRHPINPNIYGVAHAATADLNDLNTPLNRNGGNNTTRYNWQLNADNRGNDWYYESIGEPSATAGERGDTFIANARAANASAMLTIPMIDWVAKLGSGRSKLASFSVAKYGAQTGTDWQWFPDAGNGVRTNGQFVTGNNPNDANVPSTSLFQQGWVQHLVNQWGTNADGGLRYYILDNEPSIWHSTHRDVQPTGATMDDIKARILDYGAKIKAIDPSALVAGPEEWGWSGYFFSGYDQQYGSLHGWSFLPDRSNHGGADYLPWLLGQLRQNNTATGVRLLDIFTVHYYPQSGEFSDDVSNAMQLRRNRSTRSLWDPAYVDESWINDRVQLIPRLKNWMSTYYPGTQTGITEYNWGAENHINGATAQADIFGIFGREGLDTAARWTTPASSTPTYKAMKMYRNYDGNKSTFGETSVAAATANPDTIAAFAAERSADGALTVMVISKFLSASTPATINLANFQHRGTAQVWRLAATSAISRLSDVGIAGSSFDVTLPPQSITLFVIAKSSSTVVGTAQAGDFDGDRKADVTVYRPSAGRWFVLNSSTGYTTNTMYTWGTSGDTPVPGDYDGDGKSDIAVYRPSTGQWFILQSASNYTSFIMVPLGAAGDVPAGGDYDGDGKADIAVYRPSTGQWVILQSTSNYATPITLSWGVATDVPVAADYDGDGKADVAVYRPSTGQWFVLKSNAGYTTYFSVSWGNATDVPVAADYDGDGKADVAVFRASTGQWFLLKSSSNYSTFAAYVWGSSADAPVPADFDGDAKTDLAVFRPSTGQWFVLKSTTNFTTFFSTTWGVSSDLPINRRP